MMAVADSWMMSSNLTQLAMSRARDGLVEGLGRGSMVRVLSLEVVLRVPRGGREPPGWGSPWLGEVDLTDGGSVVGGKDAGHELQVSLWRAEVPLHGCEVGGWHCLRLGLVHVLGGQQVVGP